MISPYISLFIALFCVIFCLFALSKIWPTLRTIYLAKRIPTSGSLPLIGHIHHFIRGQEYGFKALKRISTECNGVIRINFGHIVLVSSNNPHDLQTITNNKNIINRDKYIGHVLEGLVGRGLLVLRDDTWKTHRRIISPAFNTKILEGFVSTFSTKNSILVDNLKKHVNGKEFDVYRHLGMASLDIVYETLMGVPSDCQANSDDELVLAISDFLKLMYERVTKPWLFLDCIFYRTQYGVRQRKVKQFIECVIEDILSKKFAMYQEDRNYTNNLKLDTRSDKGKKGFLDMLMEVSESDDGKLTAEELKEEVYSIGMTALETTATSVGFLMVLMGLYPEHQDRVYEELQSIFGDEMGRPITSEDLHLMKYLEQVIKESLRLYPTAQISPRDIPEDVKLTSCTIPKGSTFVIMPFYTHRDARYFPNPDHFDPDRFSPENNENIQLYSYFPFGLGCRLCIGYKYAIMSMKTTLASLLRAYRVLPGMTREDLENLQLGVVLKPKSGFRIRLEQR